MTEAEKKMKKYTRAVNRKLNLPSDVKKCVIASTASPYKFVKSVMTAIDTENANEDEFTLLPKLNEASGVEMPQAIKDILEANVLHTIECDIDKMQKTVEDILGL